MICSTLFYVSIRSVRFFLFFLKDFQVVMIYKSFGMFLGRLCCFRLFSICFVFILSLVVEVETVDQVVRFALNVAK